MKLKVLEAARCACLAGAFWAACSSPAFADPAFDQPAAQRVSVAPATHLDLSNLEHRVRETKAISVLQKLALQQNVDDLLVRFRAAHRSGRAPLAALRRPYDTLITNIQSVLRRDPQLASEIAASREAIWEVLADRSRFASL